MQGSSIVVRQYAIFSVFANLHLLLLVIFFGLLAVKMVSKKGSFTYMSLLGVYQLMISGLLVGSISVDDIWSACLEYIS